MARGDHPPILRSVEELELLSIDILRTAGANEDNARHVAASLVGADLRGVYTHGIWHLKTYVKAIQAAELIPTEHPVVQQETETTALIAGNWTFGQVAAKFAMDTAIEKATAQQIAIVGLVEAHHIGRLGEYAEMAAAANMISLIYSGGYGVSAPVAVPYGGRQSVLSTNPLSTGFPTSTGVPIVADYATTVMAGSKVAQARDRNEQLPEGVLLDEEGQPTTDPEAFFAGGGLLPFGGYKGYAQMLAAELLGRVFTGADLFARESKGGVMGFTGTSMMVFRTDLFQPSNSYKQRASNLGELIRAVPPAPGFEEVLLPGDLEERARQRQLKNGIEVPPHVWKMLQSLAADLGLRDRSA